MLTGESQLNNFPLMESEVPAGGVRNGQPRLTAADRAAA